MKIKVVVGSFLLFILIGSLLVVKLNVQAAIGPGSSFDPPSITLVENDDVLLHEENMTLFSNISESFQAGKRYEEVLELMHDGGMDGYVRVAIIKYWADKNGNKINDLDTDLINVELGEDNWIMDEVNNTENRIMLYYRQYISYDEKTSPFMYSITIDPSVNTLYDVTETVDANGNKRIEMAKKYANYKPVIEIIGDAIQTRNAKEAIKSEWGVDVEIINDEIVSVNH